MAKKKTISIEQLKEMANNMLKNSVPEYVKGREAVSTFIEHVLMDTDNYSGFHYLLENYDKDGNLAIVDETRRKYF